MSVAKVELGRRLFFDRRLSGNQSYACATCHQPEHAFTDGRARAVGSTGALHTRSAMSLVNVAYNATFGWANPRLTSLEAQMAVPMFNEHPVELGLARRETEVVRRFLDRDDDVRRFRDAFPTDARPVSMSNIVKAIASFERTIVSGDSPFDRYLYADDRTALSASAQRGVALFFSSPLRCGECHTGFNLSGAVTFKDGPPPDVLFHNTGLYDVDGRGAYPSSDRGLIDVTRRASDMGRFRAPTLRNIAVTAPYMHDGSLPTLESVIVHYASGGGGGRYKSNRLTGFAISAEEIADLIAFLESLTDEQFLRNPAFSAPVPDAN